MSSILYTGGTFEAINVVKNLELKYMLIIVIAIWAITCAVFHGPAIFVYIGLHLATSGIFTLSILSAMRNLDSSKRGMK
jgi:hypothetical protein